MQPRWSCPAPRPGPAHPPFRETSGRRSDLATSRSGSWCCDAEPEAGRPQAQATPSPRRHRLSESTIMNMTQDTQANNINNRDDQDIYASAQVLFQSSIMGVKVPPISWRTPQVLWKALKMRKYRPGRHLYIVSSRTQSAYEDANVTVNN